ncbi:BlaI/MecI/CopY family transcriptional regulator [Kitasatospora cineracea]|uniref:Putative transcriptional regulator n=1 Tax=Kitasatospora cineracea TaxID=88074 RepID=A0A8G1UFE8_9ACTN|nr:BlaI/MecI/CopY family transcriptional regulator [Kitasatospora cineracea]ROR43001.1 putative transcriptional regulator [Kitasatospora cineracea]
MRGFGHLEADIMERLWAWNRPASVREIVDDLNRTRPIAYTTVTTVADNLHQKGWLQRHKEGRAWIYRPTRTREEHAADLMREALGESADQRETLLRFVAGIDGDQAAALRDILGRPPGDGTR